MNTYFISVMVNNHFGVLTRISGLFARRGYNIRSLTVGETQDRDISRMTIECIGDEHTIEQIQSQLLKLADVRSVSLLEQPNYIARELFLVKVHATDANRAAIMQVCDIFRAKAVDVTPESMVLEITGDESKLEAFRALMESHGIIEISRTGVTAMSRGLKIND